MPRPLSKSLRRALVYPLCLLLFSTSWLFIHTHRALDGSRDSSLESRFMLPFLTSHTNDKSDSTAACLLVMDDNHFLIEWIAYHYHVLKLRTLVVAIDPRSLTSPIPVLERWADDMTIVAWSDEDIFSTEEFSEAKELIIANFGDGMPPEMVAHRARQRLFYYRCMQHLKSSGKTWTLLVDSDEFLSLNYKALSSWNQTAPPISTPHSVHNFLVKNAYSSVDGATSSSDSPMAILQSSPCVQIPRVRFTSAESSREEQQELVPKSVNATDFLTLRWRKHVSSNDYKRNKISKTLIDLSRVPMDELLPVDSVHLPIRSVCSQRRLHIRTTESFFVIRHYLGSVEQFMYRELDARLGRERSYEAFNKSQSSTPQSDDEVRPWLGGFLSSENQVSAEPAEYLTNVGKLDPKGWKPYRSNERCALCFFGLPRAYKEMVLPSIVKNLLIPNARHNCDIYVHFFLQHEEQAGRRNMGGQIRPDDVGLLKQAAHDVIRQHNPSADRLPHVAFTHDTDEDFWMARGEAIKKYHETIGSDGKPAYYPWAAKTYVNSSLDNMVRQWHSEEYVFKLMDISAQQLGVTYSRVGMFRSDAMYLTPIDIAMLDKGQFDTRNHYSVVAPFARMPVNDRMIYGPYDAVKIWATKRFDLIEHRVAIAQDPGMEMHSERFLNATVFPAMEATGTEIHINRDICFVRTRADISALTNDCSVGGMTRGWGKVDRKRVVEDIVGHPCTSYQMGSKKWIFVGCGDGVEYKNRANPVT